MHDGLHHTGAFEVQTVIISDSGHWPAEEPPAELAATIHSFTTSIDND